MTEHSAETPARPLLRVVRGAPDDVELAALTAVVATLAAAPAPASAPPATLSLWADRAALLRRPLAPGPNAWRGSALPR
ncbi:acyl-CoA carboxylase subunit epsilon [Goodfellowiella coeruleoviolacea]|uniref:Acyl-CoA carboxylase epsilon subunit n=1 Tax=Goodfellowiella coeruleoviolacea TaxID=334858 RepID=A0AAE3GDR4_9PSEU|nr:acyl-CoA carboxylase subunit epsilon [Goodfellowiella coeruleoviolacea]MCP2165419.1 Acyl-CoA carboxylase epsilon subunit [Goodfellowiella coeruleoviolacea]